MMASWMGAAAVKGLIEDRPSSLVADEGGKIIYVPFERVPDGVPRQLEQALIDLVYGLSI